MVVPREVRKPGVFLIFFDSHVCIPAPRILTPRGKGSTLHQEKGESLMRQNEVYKPLITLSQCH